MKNFLFLILTLSTVLGFTTSCDSQDSTIVSPFSPEQVATSEEWAAYSFGVEELMNYFASAESVDMQEVSKILTSVAVTEEGRLLFDQKVSALKGGPKYLELSKNVEAAREILYKKFDSAVLDKAMIRQVNQAYQEIRATQAVD